MKFNYVKRTKPEVRQCILYAKQTTASCSPRATLQPSDYNKILRGKKKKKLLVFSEPITFKF